MAEDALQTERKALLAEHAALEQQTVALHDRPKDMAAHAAHRDRLRAHIGRLHAFIEKLEARHSS